MTFDRVAGLPRHPHDGADVAGDMPSVKSVHGVTLRTHAARHALGGDDEVIAGWQDWTPSYTNITVGNGTVVARYVQDGKTVHVYFSFTLGSTSSIDGLLSVSLPVEASSSVTLIFSTLGQAVFEDAGATYLGHVRLQTSTTWRPAYFGVSGTLISQLPPDTTSPFTWATGDSLECSFTYEAA